MDALVKCQRTCNHQSIHAFIEITFPLYLLGCAYPCACAPDDESKAKQRETQGLGCCDFGSLTVFDNLSHRDPNVTHPGETRTRTLSLNLLLPWDDIMCTCTHTNTHTRWEGRQLDKETPSVSGWRHRHYSCYARAHAHTRQARALTTFTTHRQHTQEAHVPLTPVSLRCMCVCICVHVFVCVFVCVFVFICVCERERFVAATSLSQVDSLNAGKNFACHRTWRLLTLCSQTSAEFTCHLVKALQSSRAYNFNLLFKILFIQFSLPL